MTKPVYELQQKAVESPKSIGKMQLNQNVVL